MGVGRSEEGKEIRSEENFVDEWSGEQASARRGRKNGALCEDPTNTGVERTVDLLHL